MTKPSCSARGPGLGRWFEAGPTLRIVGALLLNIVLDQFHALLDLLDFELDPARTFAKKGGICRSGGRKKLRYMSHL